MPPRTSLSEEDVRAFAAGIDRLLQLQVTIASQQAAQAKALEALHASFASMTATIIKNTNTLSSSITLLTGLNKSNPPTPQSLQTSQNLIPYSLTQTTKNTETDLPPHIIEPENLPPPVLFNTQTTNRTEPDLLQCNIKLENPPPPLPYHKPPPSPNPSPNYRPSNMILESVIVTHGPPPVKPTPQQKQPFVSFCSYGILAQINHKYPSHDIYEVHSSIPGSEVPLLEKPSKGVVERRKWRPPWRPVVTSPNSSGRVEWRPPWQPSSRPI